MTAMTAHAPTKSDLIRETLRRRYPCADIPYGASKELAGELGVSRELVRQIVAKMHFVVAASVGYQCIDCGKPRPGHKGERRCLACYKANNRIELPCAWCGKPKTVVIGMFVGRFNAPSEKGRYKGNVFCDRVCHGQWLGYHPNKRKHVTAHGTNAEYQYGCRCRACKDAVAAYQREKRRKAREAAT